VGLGTVTDALSALRRHVFGTGAVSMELMLRGLEADFAATSAATAVAQQDAAYGTTTTRPTI